MHRENVVCKDGEGCGPTRSFRGERVCLWGVCGGCVVRVCVCVCDMCKECVMCVCGYGVCLCVVFMCIVWCVCIWGVCGVCAGVCVVCMCGVVCVCGV